MSNSENQRTRNGDRKIDGGDGGDRNEQPNVVGCSEDSASAASESPAAASVQSASSKLMASAISEACRQYEESLLEQELSDRMDNIVQFLRALDVQVIGACRADERLKPLLKINAFTGAAEDRLLSHLSQHFDPSEVGLLARCLCVPLVSIRVGKVNKLGGLLCPTATRGNLNLTLLPTSDLRISFVGDDGSAERLSTLMSDPECSAVEIEEISADKSGRSFMIKILDNAVFYFWCSEKSKLRGIELLRKMEDLLKRKPSLAELTGISESRLESFGIHLRDYLVGSTMTNARPSSVFALTSALDTSNESSDSGLTFQSSIGSKPSRLRQSGGQGSKAGPPYQGILSPRPTSSFKEAVARNMSSLRTVSRERLRRRGDSYTSCIGDLVAPSLNSSSVSGSNVSEDKHQEVTRGHEPHLLESPEKPDRGNPTGSGDQNSLMASSRLSPYYSWCPPPSSSLQYAPVNAPLSTPLSETLSLPNSLFSVSKSSALLASLPLSLNEVPSLDFPPLFPDPFMFPLSFPTSQQIPTFTPLMCDPIVHIPVIDVCSSGQGYLVSAGPAISTIISPLHPNLSKPLNPESDSVAEKSARETLRMLINSSNQQNPPLIGVFPSVLSSGSELHNILAVGSRGLYSGSTGNEMHNILAVGSRGLYSGSTGNDMHNILAVGSRGLYSGTSDVGAIATSVAAMSMISSSDGFVLDRLSGRGSLLEDLENAECFSGPRFDKNVPESEEGSC